MSSNKKSEEYTKKDMDQAPSGCNLDRVKSGWNNVVKPTINRLGLQAEELTMIDVGSGDGRKSLGKYAFTCARAGPIGDRIKPENMAAIEGNKKKIPALKKNIPGVEVFLFNFSKNGLEELGIQKKYHVVLLCEVLEHLTLGEGQLRLLRDAAELVAPRGGMHVTFPRHTNLDCVIQKPWGHKCTEVPRHKIMNILSKLFEEVTWAQAGSTVNFFALGRTCNSTRWHDLVGKHAYSE
jgi:2-polyprenyl-3-methyl-5-hydroxy-6-metoxy-1,4-benzoquinol methylase